MPTWVEVFNEINNLSSSYAVKSREAVDAVRRKYLKELSGARRRNVIAYYSGWLSKPDAPLTDITDEDKNGFMMAVHKLDRRLGLDLILHTPGGGIEATKSIVNYLHKMFDYNIVAIVPQISMSAGTMLACACREIIMGSHSNLGPIDPFVRRTPAQLVLREFDRAYEDITNDPQMEKVWMPILRQYPPTFIDQCELAIKGAEEFVKKSLRSVMFQSMKPVNERNKKVLKIVKSLSDAKRNRSHANHLHLEDCRRIGLNVTAMEDMGTQQHNFQDLILTVHHCFMHTLMNTPTIKIIENQEGVAFVKQIRPIQIQAPMQVPAAPIPGN